MYAAPSIRVPLLLSIAIAFGAPHAADAAAIFFNDHALWQAAAGTPSATEDFSGFASDASFANAPLALNGMSIAREGPEPGLNNFVDAVPLVFAGGSGTNQAELFTNFDEGANIGTQVRITFDLPNAAFGFATWAASDFEDAILEVFDGATLLGSQALPGGSGAFLGYVLTDGDAATSVRFRSASLIVGTTGEGFAIDDLELVVVPEPGTLSLVLGGLVVAGSLRSRH